MVALFSKLCFKFLIPSSYFFIIALTEIVRQYPCFKKLR